ncbi:methylthioribulose 1-phosphate dehydratase [Roseomonas sp. PWR1]|uniref:Methylthioribulose-1-phosphate dehydratase n=1 Tax=Roseomonas nitratireducens TaxID=2820810 RepID=A0ABS4ASI3_9PROT|nr:methylthioribulose 1-phosphate dehydratase [Neoroseomonas nitratireducens]MBP0464318.1 methylthioribulose 1-phosphate dehydratase [Neoroseomonas nitratireducens]
MSLAEAAAAIVAAGRRMDRMGWVPATAGNLSVRLGPGDVAITRSGGHKGFLAAADVIRVDLAGRPLDPGTKPSYETLLHCGIYRRFADAGAVLHGHSVAATVLSRRAGDAIRLAGYELLKAFPGGPTHDAATDLPVLDNDQDIPRLQAALEARWDAAPDAPPGYVIRGHGVYVWGSGMDQAMARLEALEFMLLCHLEEGRHTR